jgi:hypothetical protein
MIQADSGIIFGATVRKKKPSLWTLMLFICEAQENHRMNYRHQDTTMGTFTTESQVFHSRAQQRRPVIKSAILWQMILLNSPGARANTVSAACCSFATPSLARLLRVLLRSPPAMLTV